MSFQNARCKPRESDATPEPRTARRAKARLSLKMQAIGFLSRREHSRQELRAKLLDSLRKRAREDAMLAAASEKAARELAEAVQAQPSNGIDDAFAPALPIEQTPVHVSARGPDTSPRRRRIRGTADPDRRDSANTLTPALERGALDTLSFADGAPLSTPLRARIAVAASATRSTGLTDTTDALDASVARIAADAVGTQAGHAVAATFAGTDFDPLDANEAFPDPEAVSTTPSTVEASSASDNDGELADPEATVDQLLDWLAANNYLSETRFVESRVNARSRKQGTLRIKLELSRHGLALEPDQAATLRETEFARAQALWQRKFGELAPDARLRAKQARFLAARGFAADVVRRVVGGEEES